MVCRFKQAHEHSFYFNFWKGIILKERKRVKKATAWKRQQSNLITLCSFNYIYIYIYTLVYAIQHFHLRELSTGKEVVMCLYRVSLQQCHFLCTGGPEDDGKCVMEGFCDSSQMKEELCFLWILSSVFVFLPSLFYYFSTPKQKSFPVKNISLFFVYGKHN